MPRFSSKQMWSWNGNGKWHEAFSLTFRIQEIQIFRVFYNLPSLAHCSRYEKWILQALLRPKTASFQSKIFLHIGKIIHQARHTETEKILTEQNNKDKSRHVGLHSEWISWNRNFSSFPCLPLPIDAPADSSRDSDVLHPLAHGTAQKKGFEGRRSWGWTWATHTNYTNWFEIFLFVQDRTLSLVAKAIINSFPAPAKNRSHIHS